MFDFFNNIAEAFGAFFDLIKDFFHNLITGLFFIGQSITYIQRFIYWMPSGLIVFATVFLTIYIINRVTGGKN